MPFVKPVTFQLMAGSSFAKTLASLTNCAAEIFKVALSLAAILEIFRTLVCKSSIDACKWAMVSTTCAEVTLLLATVVAKFATDTPLTAK